MNPHEIANRIERRKGSDSVQEDYVRRFYLDVRRGMLGLSYLGMSGIPDEYWDVVLEMLMEAVPFDGRESYARDDAEKEALNIIKDYVVSTTQKVVRDGYHLGDVYVKSRLRYELGTVLGTG